MAITIRTTVPAEAELLSQIQKAAFLPLYEKFHDRGSPYLRGPEDILRRLTEDYRHFTILLEGKVIGGIFYRLRGKRSPEAELADGECYLCRLYIHPEYQNKGYAKAAISLCEEQLPGAAVYYVDFPEVLEKNRRCYQGAGFSDTGERIAVQGAPTLAVFRKTVNRKER